MKAVAKAAPAKATVKATPVKAVSKAVPAKAVPAKAVSKATPAKAVAVKAVSKATPVKAVAAKAVKAVPVKSAPDAAAAKVVAPSTAAKVTSPAKAAPAKVSTPVPEKATSPAKTAPTKAAKAEAPSTPPAAEVSVPVVPVAAPVKETPVKVPTGKNAPIPGAMVAPASPEARAAALARAEAQAPRPAASLRPVGRSMPAAVPSRSPVKLLKAPAINTIDEFDGIEELGEGQFLTQQKALLLTSRDSLRHQAESLQAEADQIAREMEPGDVQFDDESGEGGTLSMERERDLAMSAQFLVKVEEVEEALARIDTGEYGYCGHCQKPISRQRLRALPFTTLCIVCKNGGLSRR